jgi:hypothetical protein
VEVKQELPTSVSRAEMKVIFVVGVIVGLLAVVSVFGQSDESASQTPSTGPVTPIKADTYSLLRDNYAGDSACAACHRERVESFHQTAHYLTSRLPDRNSILGSFMPGTNAFTTSNPDLSFRMDEKGTEFFQTAVQGIAPYTTEHTERFSLVVGSGGKGQTYLFWKGDQLFQLPVSYWTELGWVNSPGYRDGVANFDRPVMPRCLECHATYFEATPPPFNRYRTAGFVVGITCEKCHGPGIEHVNIEGSKSGSSCSAILNPATLSRNLQMDVCAWCHAGAGTELAPTFSYLPGESLSKYLALPPLDPNSPIDVHGSQLELLEKSRCFQLSQMTCSTCHDVHTPQHDLATFSRRCLGCHKPGTAMFPKLNHKIDGDCIVCHMPREETNLIVFDWKGRKVRPQVRTHWIKAYPVTKRSD